MKTLHKVLLSVTTFLAVCALLSTASAAVTVKVLHTFVGSETGFQPSSGVIFDSSGNLYGELAEWDYATGMVYKLSPNPDGTWSETVLYEFTGGADGAVPEGGLTFDGAGNLYGTATQGFRSSAGVVFKLSPNPDGTWSESVIYSFTGGADGSYPASGVIFDAAGNLYGTASYEVILAARAQYRAAEWYSNWHPIRMEAGRKASFILSPAARMETLPWQA